MGAVGYGGRFDVPSAQSPRCGRKRDPGTDYDVRSTTTPYHSQALALDHAQGHHDSTEGSTSTRASTGKRIVDLARGRPPTEGHGQELRDRYCALQQHQNKYSTSSVPGTAQGARMPMTLWQSKSALLITTERWQAMAGHGEGGSREGSLPARASVLLLDCGQRRFEGSEGARPSRAQPTSGCMPSAGLYSTRPGTLIEQQSCGLVTATTERVAHNSASKPSHPEGARCEWARKGSI